MPLVALVQGATAFNCGSSATLRRNIASGEVVFKRFYKVSKKVCQLSTWHLLKVPTLENVCTGGSSICYKISQTRQSQ